MVGLAELLVVQVLATPIRKHTACRLNRARARTKYGQFFHLNAPNFLDLARRPCPGGACGPLQISEPVVPVVAHASAERRLPVGFASPQVCQA
jgi:hypothetical protein